MAVKETSETPSSSLELETDSELGELQSDYPEESPYEVMTIATTSVDVETETIMVTVYMDSGIPTVTVTEVVTDTWSSGNADQSFTIPAQLQAPVIVTVTQTSTSYISDTINLPTSVTVVSVTDVVTETASPTTPPPITMTETTTEYTTETVTMSTTLAPLTDMETVMETSTDVDVVYTSVISTSYDIQTRTFTLANGFLSYKVGFSEELWAPTYTQTTTMVTNVYITSVIVV
ncbi:hypothetical protein GGH99_003120 [Coemansia sp. RSA 1285]|nr:hypothetical protein GGH99_003120 [Coemansia sp. RSA 1285]